MAGNDKRDHGHKYQAERLPYPELSLENEGGNTYGSAGQASPDLGPEAVDLAGNERAYSDQKADKRNGRNLEEVENAQEETSASGGRPDKNPIIQDYLGPMRTHMGALVVPADNYGHKRHADQRYSCP